MRAPAIKSMELTGSGTSVDVHGAGPDGAVPPLYSISRSKVRIKALACPAVDNPMNNATVKNKTIPLILIIIINPHLLYTSQPSVKIHFSRYTYKGSLARNLMPVKGERSSGFQPHVAPMDQVLSEKLPDVTPAVASEPRLSMPRHKIEQIKILFMLINFPPFSLKFVLIVKNKNSIIYFNNEQI